MHILTNVMPHAGGPVMALRGGHGGDDVARAQPGPSPDGPFLLTDSYDAMINAFDRRFLPMLLPYATSPHATSEWHSQATHFLVMFACFGQSAVVPTSLWVANGEHRPYHRGLNIPLINIVARDSYSSYIELKTKGFDYNPMVRTGGPFIAVAEVKSRVSFHLTNKLKGCSPLDRRFNEWKASMGECQ